MQIGINAPPFHPNCRCTTVLCYEDDYGVLGTRTARDEDGKNVEVGSKLKYSEWKEKSLQNGVENSAGSGIIKESGALTQKNDFDWKKRDKHAELYYEEILNRDRESIISKIASNTEFSEDEIRNVLTHVFDAEHKFRDGSVHKFYPDYDMAQSWQRLENGKDIKEHDIILVKHELYESRLMKQGVDIYEDAHEETEKRYNYKEALMKYLKDNDLE